MAKKYKYTLECLGLDTLEVRIEISKRVYEEKMKELDRQIREHAEDETAPKREDYMHSRACMKEEIAWYSIGTTDIILTKMTAYPGYSFK